jgi:ribosomal-protein-alanine N-acetyltransferase
MLESFIKSYEKNNFGYWACIEKSTGNIIGHCGLGILPDGKFEIAYLIDKPYWGKGITTAIAKETLRYGFETLRLKEIVAIAYPQNIASTRVMEKIGLEPSGEREYFGKRFTFYSMVNPSQL